MLDVLMPFTLFQHSCSLVFRATCSFDLSVICIMFFKFSTIESGIKIIEK
jgi:hypothetical protein